MDVDDRNGSALLPVHAWLDDGTWASRHPWIAKLRELQVTLSHIFLQGWAPIEGRHKASSLHCTPKYARIMPLKTATTSLLSEKFVARSGNSPTFQSWAISQIREAICKGAATDSLGQAKISCRFPR